MELCVLEDALEHIAVEFREVEDAQLAPLGAHVFDDVVGAGFAEGKFVLLFPVVADERGESVHREGVVLGGDGEDAPDGRAGFILVLQKVCLFHDLPGIGEKARPVVGEVDTPVIPVEDGDAHFLFQIGHGFGQAGLGDIEFLRGHADGAGLHDLQNVAELLQCHDDPSLLGDP